MSQPEQLDLFDRAVPEPDGVRNLARHFFSPGAAPQHKRPPVALPSGWVEQYKVTRCKRDYWYFRYCWRDEEGVQRHRYVPPTKLPGVKMLIANRLGVDRVLEFLKTKPR